MARQSAGLLPYRCREGIFEVLIVHPGGPYFAKKDDGVWSVAKGEYDKDEGALAAAEREFQEEVGSPPPPGNRLSLGHVRQGGGKRVSVWAVEGDVDVSLAKSNLFEMEWPPRSGLTRSFPEVDRAEWFDIDRARVKLVASQTAFLDRLVELLAPGFAGKSVD